MKKSLFVLLIFYVQFGTAQIIYKPYFQQYTNWYMPKYQEIGVKTVQHYVQSKGKKVLLKDEKFNRNGYYDQFIEYNPKNGKIAYQANYYYASDVDSCIEILTPFHTFQPTYAAEPLAGVKIPLYKDKDSNIVIKTIFHKKKDSVFTEVYQLREFLLYEDRYWASPPPSWDFYLSREKQLIINIDTVYSMRVVKNEPLLLSVGFKYYTDLDKLINIKYEFHQKKKRIAQVTFRNKGREFNEDVIYICVMDVHYNAHNEVVAITSKFTSKEEGVNRPNGNVQFIYTDTIPLKHDLFTFGGASLFSFIRDTKRSIYQKNFIKGGILSYVEEYDIEKTLCTWYDFNKVGLLNKTILYPNPYFVHDYTNIFPNNQIVELYLDYTYW